jgi:L-lactate dehydrogenase complex protein LldG
MASSRENILNRLRAARRPFPDAPPRPRSYLAVTPVEDTTPDALLARFTEELERLTGHVHLAQNDAEVVAAVRAILAENVVEHVLAWDFQHIPAAGLEDALRADGVEITFPDLYGDDRQDDAAHIRAAGAGIIGADAALATTGTLVLSTAPGRGRTPTVLPPRLIAIITLDQLLPNIEGWLARERAEGLSVMRDSANVAFVTGPSRTGDIEMVLVLGVHGPGEVHVIVKMPQEGA